MSKNINKQLIDRLDLSDNVLNILKYNKIETIEQLTKNNKKSLRSYGLTIQESQKIEVELQLHGLLLKDSV